jgi:predicted nucleic acid-binding Zn ribbon protein
MGKCRYCGKEIPREDDYCSTACEAAWLDYSADRHRCALYMWGMAILGLIVFLLPFFLEDVVLMAGLGAVISGLGFVLFPYGGEVSSGDSVTESQEFWRTVGWILIAAGIFLDIILFSID